MLRARVRFAMWVGILGLLPWGSGEAGELRPAGVLDPADGQPGYFRLVYRAGPDEGRPTMPVARAIGSSTEAFIIREARLPGAGSEVRFIAATAGARPTKIAVDHQSGRQVFDVYWQGAPTDMNLPRDWREAAADLFTGPHVRSVLPAFRQFARNRLNRDDPEWEERSRRRLQRARRGRPSTFDLTTGAAAIEESLQLERLLRVNEDARAQEASIPIADVTGVTVRSHPWTEMLDGRKPPSHPIESFVPEDQYALEMASMPKALELLEWVDRWGGRLLRLSDVPTDDAGVRERLERQLCLRTDVLARKIGPLIIQRVAATGGDPFLREGADLTLVFQLKSVAPFLANLEKNRLATQARFGGARRVTETHRDHKIVGVVSPLRKVSSFSAQVGDYVLVSNSLVGLRRSLDAHDGKLPSQKTALDRRYVRTLLAPGEKEDAFLFLSDAFIRRLVGPQLKIAESRRLQCSASLRSIAQATAWRHVRGAKTADDLSELLHDKDLPARLLHCPEGGEYRLLPGGRTGACHVHGSLEFLTPNAEQPVTKVTASEKLAYTQFRNTYQRYWRRYFDPIGIQIGLGQTKRIETVVLPLIDMGEYRHMSDFVGGKGHQKGPAPELGDRTAAFLSMHLNREGRWFREGERFLGSMLMPNAAPGNVFSWVGDRLSFFAEDAKLEARADGSDLFGLLSGIDKYPIGFHVAVRDKLRLAVFLGAVKAFITSAAPGAVEYRDVPEYKGVKLVEMAPRESHIEPFGSLYYGIIGDGLYVSFHRPLLNQLIDRWAAGKAGANAEADADADAGVDAGADAGGIANAKPAKPAHWIDDTHLAFALRPGSAPKFQKSIDAAYSAHVAERCRASRQRLQLLERLGITRADHQRGFHGATPMCPAGVPLRAGTQERVPCGVHGPDDEAVPELHPLADIDEARVRLNFTEDGVRAVLEVQDKGAPRSASEENVEFRIRNVE